MKYGQNFERESVPGWSLHNIDYNSLKHFIKVHTTRDEAKAIAIPGQPDTHLAKVEDDLYHELCIQHDRAGLFVTAKADEISRRLQHLSDDIHRFLLRCADSEPDSIPRKRQLKYMKLEREVVRCGNDIQDLRRFVGAQAIAFRKLLKKYKKWTGSASLGARFREHILNQPTSFTKKDFESLQQTYEGILSTMHNSTPARSIPSSPALEHEHIVGSATASPRQSLRRVTIQTSTAQTYSYPHADEQPMNYWNEYDNGSENGDVDDAYAIYVSPDEPGSPDFKAILHAFTRPFSRARSWVKSQRPEDQPLLVGQGRPDSTYGSIDSLPSATESSYFTHPPGRPPPSRGNDSSTAVETDANEDMDIEAEYSSSEEFPAGYETHYASLPSIQDQRMHVYKDRVLFLATSGLFSMAFLLLGISTVLIFTGRRKLRVEVDAGATLGSVISIGCGCTALALTLTRWDNLSIANRAVVMVTFITVFVLNGMLLVLVLGNTAL